MVASLLESGWAIDTSFRKLVPRDWHSLVALAFVVTQAFRASDQRPTAGARPTARAMTHSTGGALSRAWATPLGHLKVDPGVRSSGWEKCRSIL